jgi:hypothetical protein
VGLAKALNKAHMTPTTDPRQDGGGVGLAKALNKAHMKLAKTLSKAPLCLNRLSPNKENAAPATPQKSP